MKTRPQFPWIKMAPYGGGSGAPNNATYVTLSLDGALSDERTLAVDSSLSLADAGANGAVTIGVNDSGISVNELADSAVTSAKIADSSIATIDLQDSAVTAAKLGDTAVTTTKINNDAVTYAKLQNVSAARLLGRYDATAAGDAQEISLAGGLTFDSNTGTLSSDTTISFTLSDSQVDSSILADSAVSTVAIQDSAILTAKISDSQITYAKIQAVTAARLLGRYDAAGGVVQEMGLAGGLSFDSDAGVLQSTLSNNEVDSSILADNSVSTAGLQDSAVTTAKLGDTSVTTTKINNDAVTYAKIQNVTAGRILGRVDTAAGDIQELSGPHSVIFDSDEQVRLVNDSATVAERKVYGTDSDGTRNWRNDSDLTNSRDASTTLVGVSEHATAAEINTGTDTSRVLSVREFVTSNYGSRIVEVIVTDTTLATGDGKAHFNIPSELDSWDLIDADACVDTNTSGTVGPTIQIRNVTGASDFLSTKITIDTSELTSYTAATPPVIDTGNDCVNTGDRIAIDVDSAGTASGLRVILSFRKP